jgi:hypothetical protein
MKFAVAICEPRPGFNAVVDTNTAAIALWESLGLETVGIVPEGIRLTPPRSGRTASDVPQTHW